MNSNTTAQQDGSSRLPPAQCSEVVWINADVELPDDEMTVLMALSDGEVWTGFRDAGEWRYVSADPVDQGNGTKVLFWAAFPEPPNDPSSATRPAKRHDCNSD